MRSLLVDAQSGSRVFQGAASGALARSLRSIDPVTVYVVHSGVASSRVHLRPAAGSGASLLSVGRDGAGSAWFAQRTISPESRTALLTQAAASTVLSGVILPDGSMSITSLTGGPSIATTPLTTPIPNGTLIEFSGAGLVWAEVWTAAHPRAVQAEHRARLAGMLP